MTNILDIKDNCAIFISSSDAYSDAWQPFFQLFFKYWPDCPFPIYLISNEKKYPSEKIEPINFPTEMGPAKYWTKRIKTAIKNHPCKYIIYFQEDYFLTQKVDTKKILDLLEIMEKENAGYLRLYPSPGPDRKFKNYSDIGEIDDNSPYRTSLQVAIWNSAVLNKILRDDESLWDFELKHQEKIEQPFLSVKRKIFFPYRSSPIKYIATGIQKGKWNRSVLALFKKENIILKTDKQFESKSSYLQHKFSTIPFLGQIFRQFYRIKYKVKTILGF